MGELLPQKRQLIDGGNEAVNDNMGSLVGANGENPRPGSSGIVPTPALGEVGRNNHMVKWVHLQSQLQ